MQQIEATLVLELSPVLNGRELSSLWLGWFRDVLVVSSPAQGQGYGQRLHHFHEGGWEWQVELENIGFWIQPLPGDGYLVVDFRDLDKCEFNAREIDAFGETQREWAAGEYIEDVQSAPNGDVWVSHFDQAFTSKWGDGLNCFDAARTKIYDFNADRGGGMMHCYALNVVSSRDVWTLS